MQPKEIGSLYASHWQKWHSELGSSQLLDDCMATRIKYLHSPAFTSATKVWRHTKILFEAYIRFLYDVDNASSTEKIYIYAVCCTYGVQVTSSLAHQFAQQ